MALRLLCDEMLQRLGRWLRAAGYDTAIAPAGEEDGELLEQALAQGRVLLTRDRQLAAVAKRRGTACFITANDNFAAAREITATLQIDWLYAPFSRCTVCNTSLQVADPTMWQQVPESARRPEETLLYCPGCGRLYWNGSHARRIRRRLELFAAGDFAPHELE